MFYEWKLNIAPLLCNRLDSFRRPCGWVSSDTLAVSSKAAPDTIPPIVQWQCQLQSPRSLAFISCKFAALYTSIRRHQTQHATSFYIWTSPLRSPCACICMSLSLCRYRVLIFFLYFLSSYIYIYKIHICIYIYIYISLSLYICILYMPISVSFFPPQFLSPLLQFYFTLPQFHFTAAKKLRKHAHAFHFPARFQVQLTYPISTFMWPLAFVHPPRASSTLWGSGAFRRRYLVRFRKFPVQLPDGVPEGLGEDAWWGSGRFRGRYLVRFRKVPVQIIVRFLGVLVQMLCEIPKDSDVF